MQEVTIDLRGVRTEYGVLKAFGEALYFGGPNKAHNLNEKRQEGWGYSWHGMKDCLSCLDSGGIWQTSPKFSFPLHLKILHNGTIDGLWGYPQATMLDILGQTKTLYLNDDLQFSYELVLDSHDVRSRPAYRLLTLLRKLFSRSMRTDD